MKQVQQLLPSTIPTMSFLEMAAWALGAMCAMCGIIIRQGYKGYSLETGLNMDKKLKIQKEEFDKKLDPVIADVRYIKDHLGDVHYIKNHLIAKDGTMLMVHDLLSRIDAKL